MDEVKKEQNSKERLSTDGKWKSFPKVPNLFQYTSTGQYYYRVKVAGKVTRKKLGTDVWTNAKMLLAEKLNCEYEKPAVEEIEATAKAAKVPWILALQDYYAKLAVSGNKEASNDFRRWCVASLLDTWPELANSDLAGITRQQCNAWGARVTGKADENGKKGVAVWGEQYYNNVLGTLRGIFKSASELYEAAVKQPLPDPTRDLKRLSIKPCKITIPSKSEFPKMVEWIRARNEDEANLVEFLAYSGCRVGEAQEITWSDVRTWKDEEGELAGDISVLGEPEDGTKNREYRQVPILKDMFPLLERLKARKNEELLLAVFRCQDVLDAVCEALKIVRITHHDLRHLFATRCIESGVEIPTVARWLGHKDGGALAMRTYGHLRKEHSQMQARKVQF